MQCAPGFDLHSENWSRTTLHCADLNVATEPIDRDILSILASGFSAQQAFLPRMTRIEEIN
jgi:hypothetical protein